MCGIFGVNSKLIPSNYNDIFKSVGILSESRGKEASGWAAINDKGIYLQSLQVHFLQMIIYRN